MRWSSVSKTSPLNLTSKVSPLFKVCEIPERFLNGWLAEISFGKIEMILVPPERDSLQGFPAKFAIGCSKQRPSRLRMKSAEVEPLKAYLISPAGVPTIFSDASKFSASLLPRT